MQTKIKYLLVSFIFLLTTHTFSQNSTEKFVVVLDAGHGGKDPGRPTKYDTEKEIALNIVLKIGKRLEKHKNIKVIYTRKTDVFIGLKERARIANQADADLFVSVHCNAHNTQAFGAETYVLGLHANTANFNVAKQENEVIFLEDDYETQYEGFDPNSPESLIGLTLMQEDYLDQSIMLASFIQDKFTNALKRRNRGVKQAGFWVLHNTYMPSVLVETGFITNKKEGAYLSSNRGQNEMAESIETAILKYKASLNSTNLDYLADTGANTGISDTEEVYSNVSFKVQIAASSRELETKPFNFNGLDQISRLKNGKMYRYYYGETEDYSKVKSLKNEAIKKGFATSFIVAFKNGERVPLNDVLKSSSN
ncbi:MAG: N-acetylmuramoyl-L-alanine amidase [Bacteroidia bacterium]|nr:N-acetylmuramoyl-L-alanine amidase [Bacteroidia bacterium]NND25824.1 N-acetylmuramoyl-L-alanine amidase [Flavobacteriaceae bacterium]MBT8279449.1 N-acetylmuramoyl-L-alanine amidase [Bacteroidia bacterium]NNK60152.1 N-acetylmuramoyl-L-alanine amidase [Flavobacteriaceae bacterium]NNL33238.1 N-acetylmuramoyl-L-alanine amidase [Flavobacteriaceae bacterium]